jgi:hypothetical protein
LLFCLIKFLKNQTSISNVFFILTTCTKHIRHTILDITTLDIRHTTLDIRHITLDIRHTTKDIRHTILEFKSSSSRAFS